MALSAINNLGLLEVMTTGDPALKPGLASEAFFKETLKKGFSDPTLRNSYLNNAFNLFKPVTSNPREWEGLADRVATRRSEFGATVLVLDGHGVPGTTRNNPNDAQNELRFNRYRPAYQQYSVGIARDEFVHITVDSVEVGRLMAEGPHSDSAMRFISAQMTQMLNVDKAQEFNTLMDSWASFASTPGIYYVHTADLGATTSEEEAREASSVIQAAVFNISNDFTNKFSVIKFQQTVPVSQLRLVIKNSAYAALKRGYGSTFNPEYVFALDKGQIIPLPDAYFDERPEFAGNKIQWALIDAGDDLAEGGTFVVVDSLYEMGVDPYAIKQTENRALRHASFLDINPFKTLVHGGPGVGTSSTEVTVEPVAISLEVYYGNNGVVADGGVLPRGEQFSTNVRVTDAAGAAAGSYEVTITGATSPTGRTEMLRYSTGKISEDELSSTITVTATSLINPAVTVSQTFDVGGLPAASLLSGQLIVNPITFPGVFAPGTGTGGTYTYVEATGVVYEVSTDGGVTYEPLAASPAPVASGDTITVRAKAASGYTFADNTSVRFDGPHTAA